MDEDGPTALFILFGLMMLINMFFYGAGESIRSLNVKDVERRAEENDKKAIKILKYIEKPSGFVNSMQIIVTTTNIVIGMILLQIEEADRTAQLSSLVNIPLSDGILHKPFQRHVMSIAFFHKGR